ncbi:MAG: hypothetical protein IJT34_10655 [Butyrivibrio sp.]|nr:hypothetical protein [Butyrivibrio sp.]
MGIAWTGEEEISVRADFGQAAHCAVEFASSDGHYRERIEIPDTCRFGSVRAVAISGVDRSCDRYRLIADGRPIPDARARLIEGYTHFGQATDPSAVWCRLEKSAGQAVSVPSEDGRPCVPYEQSFIYSLHVRGFSKRGGGGVAQGHQGTYAGLAERLPYLKSLGVTTVELLPVCEMESVEEIPVSGRHAVGHMPEGSTGRAAGEETMLYSENGHLSESSSMVRRLNFWGFKPGYYFAPRTAYASEPSAADEELKEMIRTFHREGMEVVLQFYFPEGIPESLAVESLRYWAYTYQVDGFRLKGSRCIAMAVVADPVLSDRKLWTENIDEIPVPALPPELSRQRADYRPDFLYAARRFLRGDDNCISDFLQAMIRGSEQSGTINFLSEYEGFRLADLVSYEHKHNEANGEANADGTDNNLSWNCGVEGRTRRTQILSLRKRQMKNALTMLFLAHGTPMLYSGDEFADTQNGNNNPYCQDNPVGWVDWRASEREPGREILNYVRFLSGLRRNHRILQQRTPFRLMDTLACGYPDLSFHGREAWRPDFGPYSHAVGVMYCGLYEESEHHDFLFAAFNMHWTPVTFALPKLPGQMRWYLLSDTAEETEHPRGQLLKEQTKVTCTERSVRILVGRGPCSLPSRRKKHTE